MKLKYLNKHCIATILTRIDKYFLSLKNQERIIHKM